MRFKDRSWFSDQGKIELTGLRGGKFQGFKVKKEPKALDSVGGVLWTHNLVTASAENGASTEYVTPDRKGGRWRPARPARGRFSAEK